MATAFILRLACTTAAFGGVRRRSAIPRIARDRGPCAPRLATWGGWLAPLSLMRAVPHDHGDTACFVRGKEWEDAPPVTEFSGALSEVWCRSAPVLQDQMAGAVLRVEPRAPSARFTTRHHEYGYVFDADPDRTLTRGAVVKWHTEALLDDGLLATIGTCAGALRGQVLYLLDEDQADDSPLSAEDTLTLELLSRQVAEWES